MAGFLRPSNARRNKNDHNNCLERGLGAEAEVKKLLLSNGFVVIPATKHQDMNDHWDLKCEDQKIDVKSVRALNDGTQLWDIVYIEFLNIAGNNGSARGSADLFAYEQEDHYILFSRKDILEIGECLIDYKAAPVNCNMKFQKPYTNYTRSNFTNYKGEPNADEFGYVMLKDTMKLKRIIVKK